MRIKEITTLSDAYTAIIHGVEPIIPDRLNYRADLRPEIAHPTPESVDKIEQAIRSLYRQLCPADAAKLKRRPISPAALALFALEDVLHQLSSDRYAALARGHSRRAEVLGRVYTRIKHAPRVSSGHDAGRTADSAL